MDVLLSSPYKSRVLCFYSFNTLEVADQGIGAREAGAHPLHRSVTYSNEAFFQ